MPPHDLEHECTRVRDSSRVNVVDGLADSVQRSWRADRQICHRHVIIYRPHKSHDSEVPMARNLVIRDAI